MTKLGTGKFLPVLVSEETSFNWEGWVKEIRHPLGLWILSTCPLGGGSSKF
jgi:hypothetical protein